MTSASEQTSASLPDDCQDYLRGNEPCAFAPGNCKKCASQQQQPDTQDELWQELRAIIAPGSSRFSPEMFNELRRRFNLSAKGQPDELSKAQERHSELVKQLRIFHNELCDNAAEYTNDSQKDIHINNSMFFRGKSEAYSHASKKLNNIFKWLNIEP